MREYTILFVLILSFFDLVAAPSVAQSSSTQKRARPPARARLRATATYINPVFDADFADPTVIRASDGNYYAYATQTLKDARTLNIQVARSRDLTSWTLIGDALPVKPAWANTTDKFWAPHVSEHAGVFYMYYSAEPNTKDGLCLAVATARKPTGPFTDSGTPLQCGTGFVNIDPMAYDDPRTGKRLLYWGSGFEPIKVRELAADRTSFARGSSPVDLIAPIKTEDLKIYQRLVEGAWVTYRAPYYYLFYSGDNCCGEKAHYAAMVARSRSATGPFETYAQATGREQSVILERKNYWIAPGHNSVIRDAANQDWMFYHAIDPANPSTKRLGEVDSRRVMLMDKIIYRDGWALVEGGQPSTTPRRRPRVR